MKKDKQQVILLVLACALLVLAGVQTVQVMMLDTPTAGETGSAVAQPALSRTGPANPSPPPQQPAMVGGC